MYTVSDGKSFGENAKGGSEGMVLETLLLKTGAQEPLLTSWMKEVKAGGPECLEGRWLCDGRGRLGSMSRTVGMGEDKRGQTVTWASSGLGVPHGEVVIQEG